MDQSCGFQWRYSNDITVNLVFEKHVWHAFISLYKQFLPFRLSADMVKALPSSDIPSDKFFWIWYIGTKRVSNIQIYNDHLLMWHTISSEKVMCFWLVRKWQVFLCKKGHILFIRNNCYITVFQEHLLSMGLRNMCWYPKYKEKRQ